MSGMDKSRSLAGGGAPMTPEELAKIRKRSLVFEKAFGRPHGPSSLLAGGREPPGGNTGGNYGGRIGSPHGHGPGPGNVPGL